jgi:hypothetical protein
MKLTKLTGWDAAFAVAVIAFVIFKIPHLYLNYYWDESWSYAPALHKMAERSISLMPGAIPPDNYRGHPTLFYAMGGAWLKIFGTSRLSFHAFPMTISVAALTMVYVFGRRFFSPVVGFSAVILLIPQGYFLTQSSMGLPEVAVMFWVMLSFYFFFQNRWWAYVFAGSCLVMTKESGLAFIAALLLGWLIECLIKIRSTTFREWFITSCRIAAPLLPFAVFFLIQKMTFGWFLFPEHVGFMLFDFDRILTYQAPRVFDCIFWQDERHTVRALFIIGTLFLIGTAIWKRNATQLKTVLINRIVGYFLLFFLMYIIFSFLNVFTVRYILCCLPILTLLSADVFYEGLFQNKWITSVVSMGIGVYLFIFAVHLPDTGDVSWGMYDEIEVQDLGIKWFEKNVPFDAYITTVEFLAAVHLKDPTAGGLSSKNGYTNVSWDFKAQTEYYVVTDIDVDSRLEELKRMGKIQLIQHFARGRAWYDIYKMVK